MDSHVKRAFKISHETGLSLLVKPKGWHVSVPTYIAALERRVCPSTLQDDVERELAKEPTNPCDFLKR